MHPFTFVLMMRGGLPPCSVRYTHRGTSQIHSAAYANTRPFDERGWCFFESCAASVVKDDECLWDYSMYDGGTSTLEGLRRALKAGRRPPLNPLVFADTLRARLADGSLGFTNEADSETVCELYQRGFVAAFDSYCALKREDNVLYYQSLAWGREDALVLKTALVYIAEHCSFSAGGLQLRLDDNDFDAEDEQLLAEALGDCDAVSMVF